MDGLVGGWGEKGGEKGREGGREGVCGRGGSIDGWQGRRQPVGQRPHQNIPPATRPALLHSRRRSRTRRGRGTRVGGIDVDQPPNHGRTPTQRNRRSSRTHIPSPVSRTEPPHSPAHNLSPHIPQFPYPPFPSTEVKVTHFPTQTPRSVTDQPNPPPLPLPRAIDRLQDLEPHLPVRDVETWSRHPRRGESRCNGGNFLDWGKREEDDGGGVTPKPKLWILVGT